MKKKRTAKLFRNNVSIGKIYGILIKEGCVKLVLHCAQKKSVSKFQKKHESIIDDKFDCQYSILL